jgi:hypothetical protein
MYLLSPIEKLAQLRYRLFFEPFRSGVSNTRPARCVCAARDIIKITQIIAQTTVFCSICKGLHLWPAETFFLFLRPASPFYVKMWPAYETEFETPALDD